MRNILTRLVVGIHLCLLVPAISAAPLIELSTGKTAHQGKVLHRTSNTCWLLARDGQIHQVALDAVQSYRRVAATFVSYSPSQIQSLLLREFGSEFEVAGTRHYLVCAARGQARQYADLLEDSYRTLYLYFRTRGFEVQPPEFPLIALVFPAHARFAQYCRRDNVVAARGLMGYYLRTSNRMALYDPAKSRHVTTISATDDSLRDTLIHEAIHQFAFNIGLHSRIGDNPKWVVEGVATLLEAPGIRENSSSRSIAARLNQERLIWFRNYARTRRPRGSLKTFLSDDRLFESATLDAYSQAWALSFYLIETRPRKYFAYLRHIAARPPAHGYSPSERVADFAKAFGDNLNLLEADFLRFMDRL